MDEGFNDLWTLDVANIKWTLVASGTGPKRAWGHVAAWDSTSVGIHDRWLFHFLGGRVLDEMHVHFVK